MSESHPETPTPQRWWNSWTTVIIVSVFASALIIAVVGNWVVMPFVTKGSKTEVPDLFHEDVAVAKRLLYERELIFVSDSIDYVWDDEVPVNCVVSQEPAAYTTVKQSRRVRVVLSSGPPLYEVPAVVNRSEVEAGIRIEQQGFRIGTVRYSLRETDDRSDPYILSQSPEPGTKQPHRSKIDLVVSVAPHMPNLVGRSYEDATQIIGMLGLRVSSVTYRQSDALLPGSIVSQSVNPGERIREGDIVALTLSTL